ncbi:MAG: hypothetical protein MI864_25450 [Pseudomonadales bacterium]|nr:hypothetical protein [Pseudomonadales bacterium]
MFSGIRNLVVRSGVSGFACGIGLLGCVSSVSAVDFGDVDFSATWEQEWAIDMDQGKSQKFEAQIEPQWQGNWLNQRWTLRLRVRADGVGNLGPATHKSFAYSGASAPAYQNERFELGIREWFVDGALYGQKFLPDMEWRLGKQQVVWGQADGLKVLDVVNPQRYREFILDEFEDARIPTWMTNVIFPIGEDSTLQLLWIPDMTYHELAEPGTPFQVTTPEAVPVPAPGEQRQIRLSEPDKPGHLLEDSELGLRFSTFTAGWDLTLNYLYHYQDVPVWFQHIERNQILISPEYKRNHLFGGSASNALGDFTIRAEVGYRTDRYLTATGNATGGINKHPELSSVLGLDWQGVSDTLISAQWFQRYLINYRDTTVRDQFDQTFSFLVRSDFVNQTWRAEFLALHSINNNDGLIRPKVSHELLSELKIWAGADVFYGSRQGLYGQFSERDRILVGFELGF